MQTLAAAVIAPSAADLGPVQGKAPDQLVSTYVVRKDETLHDIAQRFRMGFLEVKAANPGVDPWLPEEGSTIVLPNWHIPPQTMERGVLINLSQMRLYYWPGNGAPMESYALGIGRDGLETPHGDTKIVRKQANPTWYPPPAMRERRPELPTVVPSGPQNPLGYRAMYLGWPMYLIHGTNKELGIGRRVSSGCIRMYNADVESLFERVPVGTPVRVVQERVSAAMIGGRLYIEVHPTAEGWDALEENRKIDAPAPPTSLVFQLVRATPAGTKVDWKAVDRAVREERGYPVAVTP